MATESRMRAWSDGALQLVVNAFDYVLSFTRTCSEPALAVTQEVRDLVARYFTEVTSPTFLDDLADKIQKQTQEDFAKGVQDKGLEADHADEKAIKERSVSLTGHEALDRLWGRVVCACECQTLPNHTIGAALFILGLKRAQESSVLQHVDRETSYTVRLEPTESYVRITLMFEVRLFCDWRSEELLIHHVFVVTEDGEVVRIEKTTVDKVEKIALDALD